jgi:ADP-heptose:LPS heptosyltransferase
MINENFENDNIINKKFDVLIDLNCKFYFDIAMLVNKIKSNYKIGFKNDFSDLFYNVQFEPHTLEAGYNKINSMLQ